MDGKRRFAVIGTDARLVAAGRALARAGFAVGGPEQTALADYILLPLPLDEKREYHTIAGLLMENLQRIPQPGEEVQVGDYMIKTLQVESHRVQKVQLIPLRGEDEMDFEV